MKNKRLKFIIVGIFLAAVFGFTIFVGTNYYAVHDFIRSLAFNPTPEISAIQEKLQLTETGEALFKATNPSIDGNKDFNEFCQSYDQSVTILGCYAGGDIHVYDIKSEDLNGIIEATVAHEMLHAAWARLSDAEREAISKDLTAVFDANQDKLSIVTDYAADAKFDELFARVGTEIANIPESLEKVYARYFKDRKGIVALYEQYHIVFDALSAEIEVLSADIDELKKQIEIDTAEYKRRASVFATEVSSFNDCANRAGCFSQYEFDNRRAELVAERESLDAKYNEILSAVEQCNSKIDQYNNNVLRTNEYSEIINSNIERVEE